MAPFLAVILLLAAALTCTTASAQMYKWVDKNGKTHYTDSPPPDDAKRLAPPRGTGAPIPTAPASTGRGSAEAAPRAGAPQGGAQRAFKPEEQAALQVMCGIGILQVLACQLELKRWCSLDELVKGVKGDRSKGFETDPRSDPNYEYRVDVRGDDIRISARPRTAGLAGFVNVGEGTHYNMGGAAGTADRMVSGGTNCAPDFKP
jgi:hypothetical protein